MSIATSEILRGRQDTNRQQYMRSPLFNYFIKQLRELDIAGSSVKMSGVWYKIKLNFQFSGQNFAISSIISVWIPAICMRLLHRFVV